MLLVANVEFERMVLIMSKGSVMYGALATALLVPIVLNATIKASANADGQSIRTTSTALPEQHTISSTQRHTGRLTESQIKKVDPYVMVVNNRYQLRSDATSTFGSKELNEVQQMLNKANENVTNNHLTIDPVSKSTAQNINTRAAWNQHYTYTNFWWGSRYYFTSNAAVDEMVSDLGNITFGFDVAGTIGTLFTGGGAAAVATTASMYFSSMSAYLQLYNNSHRHNQIYMDVNYAGDYSCHILA